MKRVIIESPYAGDVERNVKYAREALRHSLLLGEAPIASHLLHTQVLDDTVPEERLLGIRAGTAWFEGADVVAFYVNYGMSGGMRGAAGRLKDLAMAALPVPSQVFRFKAMDGVTWLEEDSLQKLGARLKPVLPGALWDDFVGRPPPR